MNIVLNSLNFFRKPSYVVNDYSNNYRTNNNNNNIFRKNLNHSNKHNYGAIQNRRRYTHHVLTTPQSTSQSTSQCVVMNKNELRNSTSEHDFMMQMEKLQILKNVCKEEIICPLKSNNKKLSQSSEHDLRGRRKDSAKIDPSNVIYSQQQQQQQRINSAFTEDFQKSEEAIEHHSSSMKTIVLGFIRSNDQNSYNEFSAYDKFKRKDDYLDKALNECNLIRNKPDLCQALLLKSMYPFLHYVICKNESNTLVTNNTNSNNLMPSSTNLASKQQQQQQNYCLNKSSIINNLIEELRFKNNNKSEFGAYEELYAIQKSLATNNENRLASTRNSGYIVTCFKLLDENYKQQSLEKSWLSWTGAREIYKYTPRTWNLRHITLHRLLTMNGKIRTFAYVLICEFGNILHPANTLQALDMCERLRARNCGHIALYQVQYCYGPSILPSFISNSANLNNNNNNNGKTQTTTATTSSHPPYLSQNSINSTHHQQQKSTSVSPNNSPKQSQQQQQQQQQLSQWSSPKILQQAITTSTRLRRPELLRGYSHDVESAHETSRRRGALLRMRDHSLNYYDNDNDDDDENNQMKSSYSRSPLGSTVGSAATVANLTPPHCATPTTSLATMHLSPLGSQQTLINSHQNFHHTTMRFQPHNYSQHFQELV